MKTALITGASGLVGSETARLFLREGYQVLGIDNDMRAQFFGRGASTGRTREALSQLPHYEHRAADIRDGKAMTALFRYRRPDVVIHCAGQPSHDWAATEPGVDFGVNATGTLNLLECLRVHAPEATFIFTSTNKVYGDRPNRAIPFRNDPTRYTPVEDCPGFSESLPVDQCMHSLFGCSKLAADLLVQEYGRYFGLKTTVFRAGCITGAAHAGAEQHGFLSYLMACAKQGKPYTVYGYEGKQVRDNIHASDLAQAFLAVTGNPGKGAVYNIGGEARNSVSVLEAITHCEALTGRKLTWTLRDEPRAGDHIWYVTNMARFRRDYPAWSPGFTLESIFEELDRGGC